MYIDLVMALNFIVDLLLLVATSLASGYPVRFKKILPAAIIGGIYGGISLLPGCEWLAKPIWHILVFLTMSGICYGFSYYGVVRGCVFFLISLALSGSVNLIGGGNSWTVIFAGFGICGLCAVFFREKMDRNIVTLEIVHKGRKIKVLALLDTGNMLKDPVTGEPVIVAGPSVAQALLGLSKAQLSSPYVTLMDHPGLRLIPYRSVGCANGMLLAVRLDSLRVNGQERRMLVAFAPNDFEENGIEAMIGGSVCWQNG